jgi:hypothetical protein
VLEDVVLVAVAMGGESTHTKAAIKAKCRIRLKLNLRCRRVEPAGRWLGEFATVFTSSKRPSAAN